MMLFKNILIETAIGYSCCGLEQKWIAFFK